MDSFRSVIVLDKNKKLISGYPSLCAASIKLSKKESTIKKFCDINIKGFLQLLDNMYFLYEDIYNEVRDK